jgi:hypothetical protein
MALKSYTVFHRKKSAAKIKSLIRENNLGELKK